MNWEKLYNEALNVQKNQIISAFIEAGGVSAALLTKKGNIYVGVCIDTACSLGMCAERNAIANMITHGESQIDKLVAIMPDGSLGTPCGACREFLMQLDQNNGELEILIDLEEKKTIKLKELIPDWWGQQRHLDFYNEMIHRIKEMEIHYERLLKNPKNIESYNILKEYMENKWQFDYEQDEQNKLPKDLKRGVLSQDGLYNLLNKVEENENVR